MCNRSPPSLPTLAGLSYTHYAFHMRSALPSPPPFLSFFCSVFTCNLSLNVQCLSCSGALRPSQWIGSFFGAEVTAPPPPPPFPIVPPSSPSSSFPPPGQAAGVGNGPDVRCMVDGSAAPAPRALGCRERDGAVLAVAVPVPRRLAPPTPPHPARSCGGRGESPPAASPASGSRGRGAHSCSGVGRTKPSCFRRGRFGPLGQICCAV